MLGLVTLLLFTIGLGLYIPKYSSLYIFGYIMTIVYSFSGRRRGTFAWRNIGIKRGFINDFKRVKYYFGLDALLFQILPPTLGIAFALGYLPQLLNHITSRLPININAPDAGLAVGSLLSLALILTLMEELVFRVTIQERLSWFIGTPAAILIATLIFGLAHAVGTVGTLPVVLLDVVGVMIDGTFFGIIYAKTHNLTLTWATHYTADVVGLLALAFIL